MQGLQGNEMVLYKNVEYILNTLQNVKVCTGTPVSMKVI